MLFRSVLRVVGRYRRQPPPGFLTPASGNPFYPGKLTRRSPRLAPVSPLPIPLPLAVTRLTQNALLVEVQPCSDPLVGHSEKGFGLAFRKVCQGPEGQRHYDLISLAVCASAVRNGFALGARALRRSDTGRDGRRWRNVGRVWRGCGGFRPLPASTWDKLAPARRLVLPGWLGRRPRTCCRDRPPTQGAPQA